MRILQSYGRIMLRAVEEEDLDLLLHVENDTASWPDSERTTPLTIEEVKDYINCYRVDPFGDSQLRMIAIDVIDTTPIGILDLYEISIENSYAYIGIYILPLHRRQGRGLEILHTAALYATRHLGLTTLKARILHHNTSSQKLFSKSGYTPTPQMSSTHQEYTLTFKA